jgi:hypothetical protein
MDAVPSAESFNVLGTMSALLGAEIVCRRSDLGGPSIEFRFPL